MSTQAEIDSGRTRRTRACSGAESASGCAESSPWVSVQSCTSRRSGRPSR